MINLVLDSYKKNGVEILKNIDITFNNNISIIGTSASGKTTLLRILEEKYNVPRVFKNTMFYHTSIEDEVKYLLLDTKQKKLVQDLFPNVNLMNNPNTLKNKEKIKLSILKGILSNKEYVSFDNILVYLSKKEKEYIIKYLKDNNIKFIIVSNDLSDLFNTDETYILNGGEIIAYGLSDKILLEEKLLKRLGFALPFMIDLSLQLKDYNLIKNVYLDKEMLVDKLWK